MKCLEKVARTADIEGVDCKQELDRFLMAYRATPHPSTGMTPAVMMFPGRQFKTRLPACPSTVNSSQEDDYNKYVMSKAKEYSDHRHRARPSSLRDTVLVHK
jgi:hypothetical protein